MINFFKRAFTLLELLIVVSIVSIISVGGISFYYNYNKNIEIDSSSKILVSDLKIAQYNSMSGLDGLKWGINAVNGEKDYYELFSTPTDYSNPSKTINFTKYLPSGIDFSLPNEGSNSLIIFDKISGRTSTSSLSISFSGVTKTINISSFGIINIQ